MLQLVQGEGLGERKGRDEWCVMKGYLYADDLGLGSWLCEIREMGYFSRVSYVE